MIEENNKRIIQNPDYYRLRQQIIEHVFGTIKRQRGFTHTIVKGKDNVLAEIALEFIMYNLVRTISILGFEKLVKMLKGKNVHVLISKITCICSHFKELFYYDQKIIGIWKVEFSFV